MKVFQHLVFFIFGAIFGSFGNVLIFRLPRDLSISFPPSFCPFCKSPIKWHDNVPIISYLLLKGRCRNCKTAIPIRYFFVEILSAFLFLLASMTGENLLEAILLAFFFFYLLVVSFIDLEHLIIPNKLNYGFLMFNISIAIVYYKIGSFPFPLVGEKGIAYSISGIIGLTALFFLINLISNVSFNAQGIGYGDIKMGFNLGIYLGLYSLLVPFFAYFLAILFLPLLRKVYKSRYIPLGPFLSAGSILILYFGESFVQWYLRLSGLQNIY